MVLTCVSLAGSAWPVAGHMPFSQVGLHSVVQQDDALSLTSLNIRLSTRPVHPPDGLTYNRLVLPNVHAAKSMIAPSPQAAILEDDARRRVVVLTHDSNNQVTAHVLQDIALGPKIPSVVQCVKARQCAIDRRPMVGGLGCVAVCLQQALDPQHQP